MKITTTQARGQTVIRLEGDLLIRSVAEVKPEILAALSLEGDILLDLREVGECDTAGIQLFLMARASVVAQGRRLAISVCSVAFQRTAERVGIPLGCFEFQDGAS